MTQEEKQLLIKDLCARLLYNPYCKVEGIEEPVRLIQIEVSNVDGILLNFDYKIDNLPLEVYLSEVKPYLRPLSSMTEEEYDEFKDLTTCGRWCDDYDRWAHWGVEVVAYEHDETDKPYYDFVDFQKLLDLLNAHHFDYRGLIEKGLALEAPKGMYKEVV